MRRLARPDCAEALFRILVEGLADRFEPRLCDEYAAIFSQIIESYLPAMRGHELVARYRRIRRPRFCDLDAKEVVVLSRVTLGADIAVTSVLLDAVKLRFPQARIILAGGAKSKELFSASWIGHLDVPYPRSGGVRERLTAWERLAAEIPPSALIVDPDSRLSQSGLLPLGDEGRYFFFESRSYGSAGDESLTELTGLWAAATFGIEAARNVIFPEAEEIRWPSPFATVSLGVGGNPAKQLPPEFEAELMRLICSRFDRVIVDEGAGGEESARVQNAIAGTNAIAWRGSFARFASIIGASTLYAGYDSAGQHAAASFGRPLLTLFKGSVSDRMFARWQPTGPGPKQVLKINDAVAIEDVASALDRLALESS